ncbi:MAG: ABC transporter substrate-binding protein [Hyphomicrobiales bacterium]
MTNRNSRLLAGAIAGFALAALPLGAAKAQSPVVEGETIGTPDLVKAACAEGQLIYYTAQSDTDERAIIAPFVKQFPCVNVSIISAVTGRLYERIATEAQAGKTQGDLAIVTDEALTQQLIDNGLARPWTPPMNAKYPANAKVEGWWYAASGSLMYPFYNTQLVKEADAPKTWKDLIDPKWKGKIASSPISIGGTAWLQYTFLLDHFGADYLKAFVAQEPKLFTAYNPAVLAVARGESLIGVGAALNEYPARIGQGAPIKPVYPPEGLPYTNYPMILLAGAPHPNAAELFGNWYLSRLGQSQLVMVRGAYSVRDDVAPAKGNPPLAEAKPWNPGHDAIIKRHDAVIETIGQIFGNR